MKQPLHCMLHDRKYAIRSRIRRKEERLFRNDPYGTHSRAHCVRVPPNRI
ncbi:hypothetical protein HNR43_002691 [Anoxybacillus mongoliensis]|uniref:Uncharacterized protein n=1 Tax=Anoxybacillus mongoliensis TaxID=452565 RepID=A0A7W8JJ61_9BACL|nr:hypothetical protein [Anoxybacillus mongoliensis]MBB5356679.1 hypothetical protein [Anoxybacillus mongoliensis]